MKRCVIINYNWWREDNKKRIKKDHQQALEETAMARIPEMMAQGYTEGSLSDNVRMSDADGENGVPYRGYWTVNKGVA